MTSVLSPVKRCWAWVEGTQRTARTRGKRRSLESGVWVMAGASRLWVSAHFEGHGRRLDRGALSRGEADLEAIVAGLQARRVEARAQHLLRAARGLAAEQPELAARHLAAVRAEHLGLGAD